MQEKYTFIDLFAGCGGLSEGFYRQGFEALAHVEINHWACETLRARMKYYGYKGWENSVIEEDITKNDIIANIDTVVQGRPIDVIIGGPPCQAYSTAGRVRDSKGMASDPRNYLFERYVQILEYYRPKFFVFENVLGILSAKANGEAIFPKVTKALGQAYNIITDPGLLIHNTADYGVPQLRKRIIIIGVRKDIAYPTVYEVYNNIKPTHWNPETPIGNRAGREKFVDVRQAIGDLPSVKPGEDASTEKFNYLCNNDFLRKIGEKGVHPLMDHVARKHNDLDRERFRMMIQHHWTFGQLRRKMPQYEHTHARLFDNSYVVQWWDQPSKTILAHIYKDGFQYIHPDILQARSFTVREAARIQSFPDDFVFMGNRSEKFKQIGNAVPPIFAEVIANVLKGYLYDF
ncbi:MAG: DNA cytosine methyltransferase [Prevotella sp.]|nr:DNA cytosine methyltransferase [Prevotella sp.]